MTGIVYPKILILEDVLTLVLFQTCMTYILSLNTKGEV